MQKNNLTSAENNFEEDTDNLSLRPKLLNEFIGQKGLKENLKVFIESAKKREANLDHTLFHGPPGLGKTTLANVIANELGVNFKATSGPMLTKTGDLAALLTNLQENDVLFIDEIHRLSTSVEEVLYSAMEDFVLDIIIGEGPAARSVRIDLPKFTLVGATTRIGLLSNPLRDRFGIPLNLKFYEPEELSDVLTRASEVLGAEISKQGALEIAKRSRGTPRIALRLLRRVWDFTLVGGVKKIDDKLADEFLTKLDVDKKGLDASDRKYLNYIAKNYDGGPVGIETISAGLSEQRDSLEETIEPFLLQIGFIARTPRGRVLTPNSYSHLNLKKAKTIQENQLQFDEQ